MQRHNNRLKTFLLFLGILAVLVGVGWVITQSTGDLIYIVAFSLMGLVSIAWSYWNSDKVALRTMRAQEVSPAQAPEYHQMVGELAASYNMPMPRLYIAPIEAPNAFATGRNPKNSAVCVTTGILRILDTRELRGVLAHELSHVANRDILTASVAAALANIITTAANVLTFGSLYGGRTAARNPLALIVAAFAAPFAAMVIRMAISRTREFDADQDGAALTQDPLGLASALGKLETATQQLPMRPTRRLEPVSAMMIANPFGPLRLQQLFASHPPMEERIRRLVGMAADLGHLPPARD